jgi:hypothetical protein
MDDPSNQMQMQKVESKKKKKESLTGKEHQQQQLLQLQNAQLKEQQAKEKQKQKEVEKQKKANEKQKKEEKTTQPAAPAPWVGMQNISGTSLSKIQKTEAQRRQIEIAAQKERDHQKLEILSKMEMSNRDVKWNLQMPPAAQVKTLDEIQAEEQNAAEREAAREAKREKKEAVQVVGDIWNTGAHSMAWQQPKAWSAAQSNAGFWEEPTKPAAAPLKQPQMLSKSQTMATITTAKKQQQIQQQQQQQQQIPQQQMMQQQQQQQKKIERSDKRNIKVEKKKDDNNNEFTLWCTRTLSAMNGNVDGKFTRFLPEFLLFY